MFSSSGNSLARRLTGTLVLMLVLILGGMAAIQVYLHGRFARQCARVNGLSLSESLYGALHSAMLANDREGLHADVRNIAHNSPNLRIRVFNKEGVIMFSSLAGEQGTRVDAASEACFKCHAADRPIERLPPGERVRSFEVGGTPALGIIKPIENEPSCVNAACHAHPAEKRLLGVLDVTLLLDPIEESRRLTTLLMSLTAGGGLLLIVGVMVLVLRGAVHQPVGRLIGTLERLGHGEYTVRHPDESIGEFHRVGQAVNASARDLQRANAELVQWAQTLERRVEAKTEELQQAQQQMIQVERMASLGKLAAVVAHEINNPLASVVTYARLLAKRLGQGGGDDAKAEENVEILQGIASEASRCGDIVSNMLTFARRQGSRMEPTDVNAVAGRVLFLLKHKLDLADVEARTELDPALPELRCDPGQLEQTLLALCVNAVEAMPRGGTLTLRSQPRPGGGVTLQVSDTGVGIPEEIRPQIFEPFFTSKDGDTERGVGLGLSVVFGIVHRHGGEIEVESEVGQGTTFTLTFPGQPPETEEA